MLVFSLVIHLIAKERKIGGNEQNLEIARVSYQNLETYSSVFSLSEQGKHVFLNYLILLPAFVLLFKYEIMIPQITILVQSFLVFLFVFPHFILFFNFMHSNLARCNALCIFCSK